MVSDPRVPCLLPVSPNHGRLATKVNSRLFRVLDMTHEREAKTLEITCVRLWAMRMKRRELQGAWKVGETVKRNSG